MHPAFCRPSRWGWRHWLAFLAPHLATLAVAIGLGMLWASLVLA